MTISPTVLSLTETEKLFSSEAVIERGLKTFCEVGAALLVIRDERLYRAGHSSFEDYCQERWSMSRIHAHRLIEASAVIANISLLPMGNTLPETERQARPLASLQPESQPAAWEQAVATAPNGKVTAAHVEQAVADYKSQVIEMPPRETYKVSDPAPALHSVPTLQMVSPARLSRTIELLPQQATRGMYIPPASDLAAIRAESRTTFNRQDSDSIEWARWSWNPVTGCLHNCDYCYARDIALRYKDSVYPQGFTPTFLPERLAAPHNTKVPERANGTGTDVGYKNCFVCSMADLWGKWVPSEIISLVMAEVIAAPQWNFLFLTKFPARYPEFSFPANAWIGTSVDRQHAVHRAEKAFAEVKATGHKGIRWLSCEPMLEPLKFTSLEMFDWVVIGGSSRSTQTPEFQPPFEWIADLYQQAREAGCKIYFKTNLLGEANRLREYPWTE